MLPYLKMTTHCSICTFVNFVTPFSLLTCGVRHFHSTTRCVKLSRVQRMIDSMCGKKRQQPYTFCLLSFLIHSITFGTLQTWTEIITLFLETQTGFVVKLKLNCQFEKKILIGTPGYCLFVLTWLAVHLQLQ